MSRTIITNSGIEFFTNISSEEFLGEICEDLDAKFYSIDYGVYIRKTLAYSMTKDEAIITAIKFRKLAESENLEKYRKKYKHFYDNNINIKEFKEDLLYYADLFEKSEGYKCIQ